MKKNEIIPLVVIAIAALFLGYKFSQSFDVSAGNVDIITLDNFKDFETRQEAFIASGELSQTDDKESVFTHSADIYLKASQWKWFPEIEVQSGREYRLHIASEDIQHSFHLESAANGEMIDVLIQPGKEYVISLKNLKKGAYAIGCTEYCGIEHNKMRGRLIVR